MQQQHESIKFFAHKCTLNSTSNRSLCHASSAHGAPVTLAACLLAFRLLGSLHDSKLGEQLLRSLVLQVSMRDTSKHAPMHLVQLAVPPLSLVQTSIQGSIMVSQNQSWMQRLMDSCVLYADEHQQKQFKLDTLTGRSPPNSHAAALSSHAYAILCSKQSHHFFILVNVFTLCHDEPKYTLFDPLMHEELGLEPGFYFFFTKDELFGHLTQILVPSKNPLLNARDAENTLDYRVVVYRGEVDETIHDQKEEHSAKHETQTSASAHRTPKRSRKRTRKVTEPAVEIATPSSRSPSPSSSRRASISSVGSAGELGERRSWIDQNLSPRNSLGGSPQQRFGAANSTLQQEKPSPLSPTRRRHSLSGSGGSSGKRDKHSRRIDLLQSELQDLRFELEKERQDRTERRELLRKMHHLYETISKKNERLEDRIEQLENLMKMQKVEE